jgi:hypothetical protein
MRSTPEADLWRAVLSHALADAARTGDTAYLQSRDFRLVCTLADLDADAVRERFDPEEYRQAMRAA